MTIINDAFHQFRLVWNYPGHTTPIDRWASLLRLMEWQILSRLGKKDFHLNITQRIRMRLVRGLTAREIYFLKLHEYDDLLFVRDVLRKDDKLIDVGANGGIYSLIAAGEAGAFCDAFEPVPAIAAICEWNIKANGLQELVHLHKVALGSSNGHVLLSADTGPTTHRVNKSVSSSIDVPLWRLDSIIADEKRLTVLKIDVEGLEKEVLEGSIQLLSNPNLIAIILETSGHGARYGHSDMGIHEMLTKHDFRAARYQANARLLIELEQPMKYGNTIYIRDAEKIIYRLLHPAH
jgi:FkbM family methyltransferase